MSGSNSNMARSHLSPGGIAICYRRTPLYPSIPTDHGRAKTTRRVYPKDFHPRFDILVVRALVTWTWDMMGSWLS